MVLITRTGGRAVTTLRELAVAQGADLRGQNELTLLPIAAKPPVADADFVLDRAPAGGAVS